MGILKPAMLALGLVCMPFTAHAQVGCILPPGAAVSRTACGAALQRNGGIVLIPSGVPRFVQPSTPSYKSRLSNPRRMHMGTYTVTYPGQAAAPPVRVKGYVPALATFPPGVTQQFQGVNPEKGEVTRVAFRRSFCMVTVTKAGEKASWTQQRIDEDLAEKVASGKAREAMPGAEKVELVERDGKRMVGFVLHARWKDAHGRNTARVRGPQGWTTVRVHTGNELRVREIDYLHDTPRGRIWSRCQAADDHLAEERPLFEELITGIALN